MSSGLSMTSVNKIKELAEAKEYSLAVEILDSQNLEKSLNPQFLRVCGEVYENVGRSKDARNMYVKAHIMGPDSNRILFSLISMYLKRGYFGLAEQYAEQYKYHVRNSEQETKNIEYVLKKAEHTELSLLQGYLHPYYSHNMDEEWSFELFLLQTIQGMDTEMLAADYRATFRRSVRSEQIQEVLDGSLSAEELFWIYADAEHQDRDPEEEEIRELEREQLKKDYLRMHPSAAAQDEEEDEDEFDEDDSAEIVDTPNTEQKFKSFLKRTFRKKPKEDGDDGEGEADENGEKADPSDGEGVEKAPDTSDKKDTETGDAGQAEPGSEAKEESASESKGSEEKEKQEDNKEEAASAGQSAAGRVKGFVSQFTDRGRNKNEMQEITPDPLDDVITYDFDDGFAAESDTISEMEDYEKESYQNPFDLINAYKITEKEKDDVRKTYGQVPKELKDTIDERKRAAEEEAERKAEAEALAEEEPEPIMEEEPEPIVEEEPEEELEEEEIPWSEPEPVVEEEPEPIVEEEPEPIVEEEPEPIVEEEPEPIVEEEPEPIVEEEPEEELEEEEIPWSEPEPEVEEEPEPIVEEEPEEEPEGEEIPWSEPEPEVEEEPEPIVEEEPEEEAPKKPAKTAFDIMMEKESEKLDEGLAEEERLQREAEALLASLGIKL